MLASPDQQISLSDPTALDGDQRARLRRGRLQCGRSQSIRNYLIVTHEVTNDGSDRAQLANIACRAKKSSASTNSKPCRSRLL